MFSSSPSSLQALSFFPAIETRAGQPRQLKLGKVFEIVPLCKLPDGSGYFQYFKLNDHPALVEEGARLIAERIKLLGLRNPYFVTPECSTLALAHVLRYKYNIDGATIYKNPQLNDIDPVSVCYDTVTALDKKTLYLGKNKAGEMRGKDIIIIDSVCTTGGTVRGVHALLIAAGVLPEQIVEATMLFSEGEDRHEIEISENVSLKLHCFAHLPLIKMQVVSGNDARRENKPTI